jgi:hypothetical protein
MGLIKQTNAQYYNGEQLYAGSNTNPQLLTWPSSLPPLIWDSTATPTSIPNFKVYVDNSEVTSFTLATTTSGGERAQIITLNQAVATTSFIAVRLTLKSLWDNYGNYEYLKLKDIVNNFMVAYVGMDKLIPRVKKSDVIFHAKRGLQEFSYDTLRSVNSQELTVPPSLSLPIPQDYVNYVQVSWVDGLGVKHPIYPTELTSNPTQPLLQDNEGIPLQDEFGENLESLQSITNERWKNVNVRDITGEFNAQDYNANVYNWTWWDAAWGQRYGLDPVTSNMNGWFNIDRRENKFSFSSDLVNQLVILEYISDGLAYDMDSRIPKLAEDALYAHISYSILAGRSNVQEYIVRRHKVDRRAKLRNAKIRLSNIKLKEFTQVMRGKSKWIKH